MKEKSSNSSYYLLTFTILLLLSSPAFSHPEFLSSNSYKPLFTTPTPQDKINQPSENKSSHRMLQSPANQWQSTAILEETCVTSADFLPVFVHQDNLMLTPLANGNLFLVYASFPYGLYGQIYHESGAIVKEQFLIGNCSMDDVTDRSFDVMGTGLDKVFIVCESEAIKAWVFSSNGTLERNWTVYSKERDIVQYPRLHRYSFQNILITWVGEEKLTYGSTFDPTGKLIRRDFVVANSSSYPLKNTVKVVELDADSNLVLWKESRSMYSDNSHTGIIAEILDKNLYDTRQSSTIHLVPRITDDNVNIISLSDWSHAVFFTTHEKPSKASVSYVLVNKDGKVIKNITKISTNTNPLKIENLKTIKLKNNNTFIAWTEWDLTARDRIMKAVIMTEKFVVVKSEFVIDEFYPVDDNQHPQFELLSNGSIFIAFTKASSYRKGRIYAKIIDQSGNTVLEKFQITDRTRITDGPLRVEQFSTGKIAIAWYTFGGPITLKIIGDNLIANDISGVKFNSSIDDTKSINCLLVHNQVFFGDIWDWTPTETKLADAKNVSTPSSFKLSHSVLPNGNVFLAFFKLGANEDPNQLSGKIVDPKGNTIKDQFNIGKCSSTFEAEDSDDLDNDYPGFSVVSASNGNIFVACHIENPTTEYFDVNAWVFDSNGEKVKDIDMIDGTKASSDQIYPKVYALSSDKVLLTWWDTERFEIRSQVFDNQGALSKAEELFIQDKTSSHVPTSLEMKSFANGKSLVVWRSAFAQNPIRMELMTADGAISKLAKGYPIEKKNFNPDKFTLAPLNNGSMLLAWAGYDKNYRAGDVSIVAINQDGTAVGKEITLVQHNLKKIRSLHAIEMSDNKILVAWSLNEPSCNCVQMQYVIVDGLGKPTSLKIMGNITDIPQQHPQLTSLKDGTALYTYLDYTTKEGDILGKSFNSAGLEEISAFFINEKVGIAQKSNPTVIPINNDSFAVAWFATDGSLQMKSYFKRPAEEIKEEVPPQLQEFPKFNITANQTSSFALPSNIIETLNENRRISLYINGSQIKPIYNWTQYIPSNHSIVYQPNVTEIGTHSLRVLVHDARKIYASGSINFEVLPSPKKPVEPEDSGLGWFSILLIIAAIIGVVYLGYSKFLKKESGETSAELKEGDKYFELRDVPPKESIDIVEKLDKSSEVSISNSIPQKYLCPLTNRLLVDPWTLICDDDDNPNTYEKAAILDYLNNNNDDPISHKERISLDENRQLKNEIILFMSTLTVEQLLEDRSLYKEGERWIMKQNEKEIAENEELRRIYETFSEARSRRNA